MSKTGYTNDQTMTDLFNDLREQRDEPHDSFAGFEEVPIDYTQDFYLREQNTIKEYGPYDVQMHREIEFPKIPAFGITREDAYTLDRFDSHGVAKPGEFPHQKRINNLADGIPWENLTLIFSPIGIILFNDLREAGTITTPETWIYSLLMFLPFVFMFTFRWLAYNYSRRFFPKTIRVGHSTILNEIMDRVRNVAVNDTDLLWDHYEDITGLIIDYNEYRLNNHKYRSEVNKDNRDKEVMVLVSKIQELDEIITDREQTIKEFSVPNIELPVSEDVYRAEFLNSVILDRGLVPEVLIENHEENQPGAEKVTMDIEVIQKRSAHMI